MVVAADFGAGGGAAAYVVLLQRDESDVFNAGNVENQTYRSSLSILTPDDFIIEYEFLPGGVGCRGSQDIQWMLTMQGLDFTRFFSDGSPFIRRVWEPVVSAPGALGDRYWMIENLNVLFQGDPDPAVTPGRINFYENVTSIAPPACP